MRCRCPKEVQEKQREMGLAHLVDIDCLTTKGEIEQFWEFINGPREGKGSYIIKSKD